MNYHNSDITQSTPNKHNQYAYANATVCDIATYKHSVHMPLATARCSHDK